MTGELHGQMLNLAKEARQASRILVAVRGSQKNAALRELAQRLQTQADQVLAANQRDVDAALSAGLDAARVDRLRITGSTIEGMAQACLEVMAQADPVGEIESMWQRPNGLQFGRMRIPLGVVMMIFESRPNVTIEAAILTLKAGNAAILRGGSEAFHSNQALAALIADSLEAAGLPRAAVQLVPVTDREAVSHLLKLDEFIDVVIPRGGESLIRAVSEQATMPVLKHYKGVCHAYVDQDADRDKALEIVFNSKVQRCGVCNALECLLVHEAEAEAFLPRVAQRLAESGVRFKCCSRSLPLMGVHAEAAEEEDWGREFLALVLAVRVVRDMDQALEHIAAYGSNHTEAILTRDHDRAMRFLREADASLVLVNASTRFNDGGQIGLGAEIGISTSKLHAYGPMGVRELTGLKFIGLGQGQVRE
ncbi:glutamate-5-semialdehyde dehydrogenase [Desulfonatronum thiosulfatophilum]|uniref:Gamma-glutamyl phosphate reductase n=1 Tax=Desulfonatronum thiosulfatophilum TaxID=617002 RepID=A0A1G6A4M5_9BACT|nr:glutamate-5-semialdehyde dehydrogenase [Desulfonatronum thiosulfatophilum]SDB03260.1 glutamate-5-semialdehyde dehydrogenase [Desulfonatronum thiosulfatophilum]